MSRLEVRWRCRRAITVGGGAAALALVLLCAAAPADAQVLALLRAIGEGGSWVRLPVEDGRAEYRSPVFPVAGMAVNGCVKVWEGNPGSWTLRARDMLGDAKLEATINFEEPVEFQYAGGMQAQLDLVVEWSEPGSTTLYLWVGVSLQGREDEDERDICEPPPRSRDAEGGAARRLSITNLSQLWPATGCPARDSKPPMSRRAWSIKADPRMRNPCKTQVYL